MIVNILFVVVVVLAILGFAFLKILERNEQKKEAKLGYRVEFVSPRVLRVDENEFAIVYHQNGQSIWFYGLLGKEENVLYFPDSASGNSKALELLDKENVKERIENQLSSTWSKMDIIIKKGKQM